MKRIEALPLLLLLLLLLWRHRERLEAPHSGKGLAPLGPAPVGRRPVLADGRLRVKLQDVEPGSANPVRNIVTK